MKLTYSSLEEALSLAESKNESKLCLIFQKQISNRIHFLGNKVQKITASMNSSKLTFGENDGEGIFRHESEFQYEIKQNFDNKNTQFEEDIRKMEMSEISKLTSSIENLGKLFANMNNIVFEQGTVIDRIDANIVTTVERVDSGNIQLLKAIEHQSTGLADALIKILGIIVIALTLLLFLKYY